MTDIHRLSENLASEDEASVSNSPQAVRIVEVVEETDHSFELAISELEKILLQPDIADKKVAVIGVAGAYRKGKSFLLNFFLRYLQWRSDHPEAADDLDGSEWMDSSSALKGFSWRGGSERDTNGILIWSKPFILKDKNSEDVVVILMDTQGAFDSQSTVKDCATIFALSTMISSIQIYNLSQNIQEDDLQHLQLFTEYGRLALEGSSSKPFQSLMFLVRDWSFPYENEFGFQGGQRLLDTRLKVSEKQHEELQSLRKHIRECFDDISCFLMPHPGLEVACNPAFDGKLTEIRDEFQQQLRVLVPRLMDPNHLVVKEINGHKITCREIVEYFKAYMKIFQGQELPEPKSMLTATAEANNLAAVACARAIYQKRMEEVCGGDTPYMNSNQLNEEHERAKNEAIREFRNARKMGGEEFSMKYMDGLVEDIEHNKESFVQVNNAKNLFKSMRTPACLVLLMIINYIGQEFFQLLGIDAIAGVFTSLLFLIITALGIWTYSRYSGNLRDAGGWIDEAVSYVWINFVSPNTRHMGAMGGALDLYDQFSGNNSTKADSFRANEERKHQ